MFTTVLRRGCVFVFLALTLLLGGGLLVGDARAGGRADAFSRNAAAKYNASTSQRITHNSYAPQEVCPPTTPTRVPTPNFTPGPGCLDVPPTGVLTATISDYDANTRAVFTNTSASCSYPIGLAVYRKIDDNIDSQDLYDYNLAVIPPNSSLVLLANNPGCALQGDAFYGDVIYSFAGGARYRERRLDDTDGYPVLPLCPAIRVCTPTATNTPLATSTPDRNAYLELVPESGAPPNGGTANVGDRFVLDLMLNAASNEPPNGITAEQSYLTFTYDLIKNARLDQITTTCVLTNTVTPDLDTFDSALQNEVCDGPSQCNFRGVIHAPGSFAYASGALINCYYGCGGVFRVAQVGLCAVAPGRALLHWQFSPPAPITRDTEIVSSRGGIVSNPAMFTDYVINIAGVTYTPTRTPTRGTPTATTPTRTPTERPTPTSVMDAFVELVPQGSAPPNGGMVNVGDRFVLDLMIHAGSNEPPNGLTAQQSYLTYTYDLIKNARVGQITTDCVLTSTVTADLSTFEATLQNEICNGPGRCNFRENWFDPGSFAFSSGGLNNCSDGCGGTFRVAQVGLCAVAPGQALLHWQFSPPAPITRDTELVSAYGNLVGNPALFTDYVINITDQTSTPTPTPARFMVGHVTWQGRPPQPNNRQQVPIRVSLTLGSTQFNYPVISTDAAGFFTVCVSSLPLGSYTWRVKGYDPHWGGPAFLANTGTVILSDAETTPVEMSLMMAGDANNDNIVTALDFNILKVMFGSSCNPCQDPRSDLNSDNLVNILDFRLLKLNFGTSGAP